jgi:hypothetical protein
MLPTATVILPTYALQHDHGYLADDIKQGPEHDNPVQSVAREADILPHATDVAIGDIALVEILAEKLEASREHSTTVPDQIHSRSDSQTPTESSQASGGVSVPTGCSAMDTSQRH